MGEVIRTISFQGAGDAIYDFEAPVRKKWEFLSAHVEIITDATVANRYIRLRYHPKANTKAIFDFYSNVVTASTTTNKSFMVHGTETVNKAICAVPRFFIQENDLLRFYVVSGQAGDALDGFFQVIETEKSN